ncbi:very short patch repair endonuclease [Kitasatospora purpeofusca]|uniref:very short patch repair endonuclease n=1 Tax=Kitasatospora purpeofusca TaxID=67352 RepID=UPI00386387E8|nr:very short patch repair endonuclease [Kitasatospora purpeofusca]
MSSPAASSPSVATRMSRQASRDTAQELAVRRLLFRWGLRYRVNAKVPGLPRRTVDILFPGPKVAVFLDGCFWHGCPEHATSPKSNAEWWRTKLDRNVARDQDTTRHLAEDGWTVLRFWEHEPPTAIARTVCACLRPDGPLPEATDTAVPGGVR